MVQRTWSGADSFWNVKEQALEKVSLGLWWDEGYRPTGKMRPSSNGFQILSFLDSEFFEPRPFYFWILSGPGSFGDDVDGHKSMARGLLIPCAFFFLKLLQFSEIFGLCCSLLVWNLNRVPCWPSFQSALSFLDFVVNKMHI